MNKVMVGGTNLNFKILRKGKVRDVYDLGDMLLLIATDRISAFDRVLDTLIPKKGFCLTKISEFWFNYIQESHHMISTQMTDFPVEIQGNDELIGRTMLVKKAEAIPIECIIRGYLSGFAWREYKDKKSVCGIKLPPGLKESEKLPEAIFTPSTKADKGHDIYITEKQMREKVGRHIANTLREKSLRIYDRAFAYAESRGILIADTKFEFGIIDNEVVIIDELLTPDSSRFWSADLYKPGFPQPSLDKQYVRDYLTSIGWKGEGKPPELPHEVVKYTSKKYQEACKKITGSPL
jgi:phosphoribosylaminoimidazole-succinocarboxamide synthase